MCSDLRASLGADSDAHDQERSTGEKQTGGAGWFSFRRTVLEALVGQVKVTNRQLGTNSWALGKVWTKDTDGLLDWSWWTGWDDWAMRESPASYVRILI